MPINSFKKWPECYENLYNMHIKYIFKGNNLLIFSNQELNDFFVLTLHKVLIKKKKIAKKERLQERGTGTNSILKGTFLYPPISTFGQKKKTNKKQKRKSIPLNCSLKINYTYSFKCRTKLARYLPARLRANNISI